jgi:hypothetical protein
VNFMNFTGLRQVFPCSARPLSGGTMSDQPDTPKQDWRSTVFLPKTDFPMKAGLAQKEPAILARWREADLYGQLPPRPRRPPSASSSTTARPTPMATSTWATR